uniref:Tail sheath n=1 Tax=Pseudomonas phage HRDY3 TaxID=3236930 RepID=A0AB39CEC3_9VIRU
MPVFDQREFVSVDEFGIDPLLDDSYEAIEGTTSYRTHTVTTSEQFNPGLIAYNTYRNVKWWRAIMVYNGFIDIWEITENSKIRIPDINEMTTRLQRAKTGAASAVTITL